MMSSAWDSGASQAPPLSAFAAQQLGADRAALAQSLRALLWQHGMRWPAWIDARPGRLQLLLADCVDPPLSATRRMLCMQQRDALSQGLIAMGLALAAPRLALWLPSDYPRPRHAASEPPSAVAALHAPAAYPSQPARALPDGEGRAWAVPAEQLVHVAALLDAPAQIAPHAPWISVVGAVQRPAVLPLSTEPTTPRQLVARGGGATAVAWVPLLADPVHGSIWEADRPLPAWSSGLSASVMYVLPASHELIRRHRAAPSLRQRAANACLACTLCTDLCPAAKTGTQPHLLMRALGQTSGQHLAPQTVAAAAGCTRCGVCSVACPAELLPGAVVAAFAAALPGPQPAEEDPPPLPDLSRLSWTRMLARLGLDRFAPVAI